MSAPECLPTLIVDDSPPETHDVRASSRRMHDVTMLSVASAVILLSFLLRVRADQRVELLGLSVFTAPETCGSRVLFGIECPGCGLTRGFIRLAAGNWSDAMALNRITPLLAFGVLAQIPYRLGQLVRWPPARRLAQSPWPDAFGKLLMIALFGNWLLKLLEL